MDEPHFNNQTPISGYGRPGPGGGGTAFPRGWSVGGAAETQTDQMTNKRMSVCACWESDVFPTTTPSGSRCLAVQTDRNKMLVYPKIYLYIYIQYICIYRYIYVSQEVPGVGHLPVLFTLRVRGEPLR